MLTFCLSAGLLTTCVVTGLLILLSSPQRALSTFSRSSKLRTTCKESVASPLDAREEGGTKIQKNRLFNDQETLKYYKIIVSFSTIFFC